MNVHSRAAENPQGERDALAALKQFARTTPAPVERCQLCGAGLDSAHQHLLERKTRSITCSCDACAILFCGQQGGRFLRIPRRVRALDGFSMSDVEWEQLAIPIQMAFFLRAEDGRVVAMYPSAAGAIESELALDDLNAVFERHAALRGMEPEVEALLVNRVGKSHSYLVAPIDECFRLTGLIRTKWHGLSGGSEVWSAITQFLSELQRRAEPARQEHHA